MPFLDVAEILLDPDFWESNLFCLRTSQTVGANGLAINTPVSIPFGGVVTEVSGADMVRNAVGELITGSILICTRFPLIDGKNGLTADIVQRQTRSYTVTNVQDYTRYGRGFVEATCELLPLGGSYPTAPGYQPPQGQPQP